VHPNEWLIETMYKLYNHCCWWPNYWAYLLCLNVRKWLIGLMMESLQVYYYCTLQLRVWLTAIRI